MRAQLRELNQVRKVFRGTFEREGKKTNWHGYAAPTILLLDVTDDTGKIVTDHIWFSKTKAFEALGDLNSGDIIEFEARVADYRKGYVNRQYKIDNTKKDYKLSRPTKVRRLPLAS